MSAQFVVVQTAGEDFKERDCSQTFETLKAAADSAVESCRFTPDGVFAVACIVGEVRSGGPQFITAWDAALDSEDFERKFVRLCQGDER